MNTTPRNTIYDLIKRLIDTGGILLFALILILFYYYDLFNIKEYLGFEIFSIIIAALIGYFLWQWQHKKELADKWFSEYLRCVVKFFGMKQEVIDLRKEENRLYYILSKGKLEKLAKEPLFKVMEAEDKDKIAEEEQTWQDKGWYRHRLIKIMDRLENLNIEEMRNHGQLRAKLFLLNTNWGYQSISDHKEIEEKRVQFERELKRFSKINVEDIKENPPNEYEHEVKHVSKSLKEKRSEIFKIANIL
ncbi:hypothetical protein COY23_00945 [bacterium (Candidatus Torokbacteria) CG_4_10_14_0_2_um_filter_35_8]|nr:MAG: hypothetical protein COY23_00945 [bacterium (Candidatus Torokbacteria) CG_4_10_14_0_2_um_filter_35_8]